MHRDRVGDVAQDHRLHRFLALFQERGLALHDRTGDLQQRLVADLEAAHQPAGLLQLGAQRRVVGGARHQARVGLVDAQSRHRGRVHFHGPAVVASLHEHVRHQVLGLPGRERGARPGVAAADQRQRDVQRLLVRIELAPQRAEVPVRDLLQVLGGDRERELETGRLGIELLELQPEALGEVARAGAGRVQRLHEREHALDVLLRHGQVHAEAARDRVGGLGQVAVVVQRVDDRLADPQLARVELADLQLPDQVLVQVEVAFVGELERPVVVVLGTPLAAGRNRIGPGVLHLDDDLLLLRGVLVFARLGRARLEGGDLDGLVLLGLQHHVRLERLLHLCLQLEDRQLQQLDRLLQLRRHRQLLTDLQVQGGLEHRFALRLLQGAGRGPAGTSRAGIRPPAQSRKSCPK